MIQTPTPKLTPSERLVFNAVRSSAEPVYAETILSEAQCSIHTLIDALKRLKRLGLIAKVDAADGPRYVITNAVAESEAL